jgi:peptidyl-prolyl cis-trans isomerase A (cyclophilin A)
MRTAMISLLIAAAAALVGCRQTDNHTPADAQTPAPAGKEGPETMSESANPVVVMETSSGKVRIELDAAKAPKTVANFLGYVDQKFYDGTIFHRVIPDFMIQGGGFTAAMEEKPTRAPIKNEAGNGLLNNRGTIAMARTGVVDSATAQFFINVQDNSFLNHRDNSPEGFGYAVFGKVIEGMDVVDKIRAVPTQSAGDFENVPATPVVIQSIRRAK